MLSQKYCREQANPHCMECGGNGQVFYPGQEDPVPCPRCFPDDAEGIRAEQEWKRRRAGIAAASSRSR